MRKLLLLIGASMFLVGTACGSLFSPAAAVVDGEKITTGEVEAAAEQFESSDQYAQLAAQGDANAIQRQFEQLYLTRLVRRRVLQPRAEELGVSVSEEDIDDRVERIREGFPSEEEFEVALSGQGLDLEQLRAFVRDRLLEQRLRAEITADAAPSETELMGYYEENISEYTETRASHILVNDEERAQRLSDRLRGAPAERPTRLFKQLAQKFSTDRQTKAEGGELGYFVPGTHPRPFEEVAAEIDPGEVSAPVETELGWHVIYVTDRRTQPFEDVRDAIEALIGNPAEEEAWQKWIIDAFEDADVKVNPRYGEFDLDTQQIVNVSTETVPGAEEPSPPAPEAGLLSPSP